MYFIDFLDLNNKSIIYISSLILALVNIFSASLILFHRNHKRYFLASFGFVSLTQAFLFSFLNWFGFLGNPNQEIKSFVREPLVSEILARETIYLIGAERNTKVRTLLEFYIPNYIHYQSGQDVINSDSYLMVNNKALKEISESQKYDIKKIGKYKNFYLIYILNR